MAKGTRFAYLIEFDDVSSIEAVSSGCQGIGVKNGLFYIKSPAGTEKILYGADAALTTDRLIVKTSTGFADSVLGQSGNIVFNSSGCFASGASSCDVIASFYGLMTASNGTALVLERIGNYNGGAAFANRKARGTPESKTVPNNNDVVGGFVGLVWDTAAWRISGGVRCYVDGTVSAGSSPGYLYFQTTPSGSTGVLTRMAIRQDGKVGIGTTSPSELLDVNGNVKASGFIVGSDAGVDVSSGTLKAVTVKKGIITAATSVTPVADGTYDLSRYSLITVSGGIITGFAEPN